MNFAKARSQFKKQIKAHLDAIAMLEGHIRACDRIEAAARNNNCSLADPAVPEKSVNDSMAGTRKAKEGSPVQMVRAVMNDYTPGETFTKNDIAQKIKEKFPSSDVNDTSVASALWNMAKRNEIETAQLGGGRTPSQYKRVMRINPMLENNLSATNGKKDPMDDDAF